MNAPLIMIAPNGARRGRADHPALPVTIPQTIEVARACHEQGAGALHLHVRDEAGVHSLDPGLYREALDELARVLPDMAVQITTESAGLFDVATQLHCLVALRPAWASVSVREIARDAALAPRVYATCAEQGTRVQHILYDQSDAETLHRLQRDGHLPDTAPEVILVLGKYMPPTDGTPDMLKARVAALPDGAAWSICAFGGQEQACLIRAAGMGASGLRIGFENNLNRPDGTPWTDMAEAVRSLRSALRATPPKAAP